MNVIWIVADTFRRGDLGCYGNPDIHTPALDALAEKSVRKQENNVIDQQPDVARELHRHLLQFIKDNEVNEDIIKPCLELRL